MYFEKRFRHYQLAKYKTSKRDEEEGIRSSNSFTKVCEGDEIFFSQEMIE